MPVSSPEGKGWARSKIWNLLQSAPKGATVLDIGAGVGTYGKIIRELPEPARSTRIEAVEAWEPYVEQYGLRGVYDAVHVWDIRELEIRDDEYHLAVLGDIIEHMSPQDASQVLTDIMSVSQHILICTPVIDIPFEPEDGNPFDRHVNVYTDQKVFDELLFAAANTAQRMFRVEKRIGSTVGYWLLSRTGGTVTEGQ